MSFEILDSSEKAQQEREDAIKFPFDSLAVGKSFRVPFGTIKESSLRSAASRASKKLNRKFRVLIHPEGQCYEVARTS